MTPKKKAVSIELINLKEVEMRKLFYLFVSLVVGLCICTSCEKIEQAEQKQEAVKKTEEVLKVWGVKKVEKAKQIEEKQKLVKAEKTEEVKKGNVTTPAPKPEATVEEANKTKEAVSEEKTTVKQVASVDLAAGKEVYEKKGMCMACHGADGSKPFKLTKLFTGEDYTVEEQEEWIEKEPQMKMLKNKLTKQDLINVTGYLNQKLKK